MRACGPGAVSGGAGSYAPGLAPSLCSRCCVSWRRDARSRWRASADTGMPDRRQRPYGPLTPWSPAVAGHPVPASRGRGHAEQGRAYRSAWDRDRGTSGFLMWSTNSNVSLVVFPGSRRTGRGHSPSRAAPARRPGAAAYRSPSRAGHNEESSLRAETSSALPSLVTRARTTQVST